jgi:hypothetical protein
LRSEIVIELGYSVERKDSAWPEQTKIPMGVGIFSEKVLT